MVVKQLPEWFPGAGFKKAGRQWAAELTELTEKPRAFVKQQMAQGKTQESFLAQLMEAGDADAEQQHTNKFSAMSLYTGGADTVSLRLFSYSSWTTLILSLSDCFLDDVLLLGHDGLSRGTAPGSARN